MYLLQSFVRRFLSLFILSTWTFNLIECMPPKSIQGAESSASPRLLVRDDQIHQIAVTPESLDPSFQVQQARANEAMWTGSARLPSSQKIGGNENTRYKIRRDGSLSIALQGSNSPTDHNLSNPTFQSFVPSRTSYPNQWDRKDKKVIPTELRSFSVVLSDVDVVGTYNTNNRNEPLGHYFGSSDPYANSGVSSYRLSSNTIHRMNALWKLNPSKTNISSDQLLNFLSLFSNKPKKQANNDEIDDGDDDYEEENSRHQKTNRRHNENHFGTKKGNPSSSNAINSSSNYQDMNSLPFSTWSETSRQLPNDNNTTIRIKNSDQESDNGYMGDVHDTSVSSRSNNNGTNPIVLHELIATLGKLIDAKNIEKNSSSLNNGTYSQKDHHDRKANRMGSSDPQQTASDLKRLMSLLLKSGEGSTTQTKDGAQVVNIVITPNNNSQSHDSKQKILFLKNPQIKRLLEIALQTPSLQTAAHKVAAGLYAQSEQNSSEDPSSPLSYSSAACSNCSPQEDIEFLQPMSPLLNLSPHLTTSSTPDGFPITGQGILNLNHPNLQFHQALHHLVANGTTPTTINATTKTNVINIFVLNLNPSIPATSHLETLIKNNNTFEEAEADDAEEDDEEEPQQTSSLRPPMIYSLKNQKTNYQKHGNILIKRKDVVSDLSTIKRPTVSPLTHSNFQQTFFNKIGLPNAQSAGSNTAQKYKPLIDVTSSHGNPYIAIEPTSSTTRKPAHSESSTERLNIFDLLPGKINSYTKAEENNHTEPSVDLQDKLRLDKETAELFSYLVNSENESSLIQMTTPKPFSPLDSLPPEFSHLSWIINQEPPPKPVTPPKRPNYGINKSQVLKKNKQKQPYFSDEDDYNQSYSVEKEGEFSQSNHKSSLNKFRAGQTHNKSSSTMTIPQESIGNKTSLYDQFLSTGVFKFSNNTKPKRKPESTTVRTLPTTKKPNNNRGIKNQGTKQVSPFHRRPTLLSSFTGNNQNDTVKQNVKGRVKKLMNALAISSLPTLAAGAAATWPYWVPIVATGRKGREFSYSLESNERDVSKEKPSSNGTESQLTMRLKPIELKVGDELERNLESGTRVEVKRKSVGMDRRQVKPGGGLLSENDKKWIRVEVITESSSPTLVTMKNHHHSQNNTTIQRSPLPKIMSSTNNRQFVNGEPQDVPLLKNFLKNVLSNEWNISTTTPSYTYSSSPTHFSFNSSTSVVRPKPSWSLTPYPNLDSALIKTKNNITKIEPIFLTLSKSQLSNVDSNKSLIAPTRFDSPIPSSTFEQSVTHINKIPGGQTTNNKKQTPINDQQLVIREYKEKRKNLAAIIHKAEATYASAALLPLWFPIMVGNGLSSLHKRHYTLRNDPNSLPYTLNS